MMNKTMHTKRSETNIRVNQPRPAGCLVAQVLSPFAFLLPKLCEAAGEMAAADPRSVSLSLIAVALVLLLAASLVALRSQKQALQARSAGLQPGTTGSAAIEGPDRTLMIIGATGRSITGSGQPLAAVLRRCTAAKILLLDPREQGAYTRSKSAADPEISIERIREEVANSIDCLRNLRSNGASISLKLYPDAPLFKLVIANNSAVLRHYHPSLNIRVMPEFVFRDAGRHGGLYLPLTRYFLQLWQDPDIPEYDFDADELIYRDQLGAEVLREPFGVVLHASTAGMPREAKAERGYVFRSEGGLTRTVHKV